MTSARMERPDLGHPVAMLMLQQTGHDTCTHHYWIAARAGCAVLESLLHAGKLLFHLSAVAGKPVETHVYNAQASLLALQQSSAALGDANAAAHRPLRAMTHVCTAVYAMTLHDGAAARLHSSAADAALLKATPAGEADGASGAPPECPPREMTASHLCPRERCQRCWSQQRLIVLASTAGSAATCAGAPHRLLELWALSTWVEALAAHDDAAPPGELQIVQQKLYVVVQAMSEAPATEQLAQSIMASLAQASCLRAQRGGARPLTVADACHAEHKQLLLRAFKLCNKQNPQRVQLLALTLRHLASTLVSDGCAARSLIAILCIALHPTPSRCPVRNIRSPLGDICVLAPSRVLCLPSRCVQRGPFSCVQRHRRRRAGVRDGDQATAAGRHADVAACDGCLCAALRRRRRAASGRAATTALLLKHA